MKRPNRASRFAVACAASALVLAACGDDSSSSEGSDSPSGDESSSEASAEPTGDGVLKVGTLLPADR